MFFYFYFLVLNTDGEQVDQQMDMERLEMEADLLSQASGSDDSNSIHCNIKLKLICLIILS
jgi:hypothetical protein